MNKSKNLILVALDFSTLVEIINKDKPCLSFGDAQEDKGKLDATCHFERNLVESKNQGAFSFFNFDLMEKSWNM